MKKLANFLLSILYCLSFGIARGQVYAPDSTFNQNFISQPEKINFLHKIDDSTFYVGTNIYDDYFTKNLYVATIEGKILAAFYNFNAYIISGNKSRIIVNKNDSTFLFDKKKLVFVDKRRTFDVNWQKEELLVVDKSQIKVINFEGQEKYSPIEIPYNNMALTKFFKENTIATYSNNKLILFDYKGNQISFSKEQQLPYFGSFLSSRELFKINDKYLGFNAFDSSFPKYRHLVTILDSMGQVKINTSNYYFSKLIGNQDNISIVRRQPCYGCSSQYIFYDANFATSTGKTLFGENYITISSFKNFYIATDGIKIYKLSATNSAYISTNLPDTAFVNDKPVKISAKVMGKNEQVFFSTTSNALQGDSLYFKSAAQVIVTFRTNSGLLLNKSILIVKRVDSISYDGLKDAFITEFPLQLSIKSKSGLPVQTSISSINSYLLINNQIINRNLPNTFKGGDLEIRLQTLGSNEYQSSAKTVLIKVKSIASLIDDTNSNELFITYPNPILHDFKVIYKGTERISNPVFEFANFYGKPIKIEQINNGNDYIYQLFVPNALPSGIYYLAISYFSDKLGERKEYKRIFIE